MGNTAWGPNGMAGGARVSTGSGIIKVYGTTFGSNAAGHRGGGLYLSSSGTVDMQNCNFLANRAGPQLRCVPHLASADQQTRWKVCFVSCVSELFMP